MKFAIDKYKIGNEKEVKADDFDSQPYIPERKNRFRCPECGEIVFFRAKGGNHPNQFFHQEKTDGTPECDKRVDGRSELSLSERIGLPIFITNLSNGIYQLGIGFSPLGDDVLKKAIESNYSVEISWRDSFQKTTIDYTYFFGNELTIIPINFIPKNGENYVITTSGDKYIYAIQRKWSNYADGFEVGGAIFSFDETGGKKVRRGDSISPNRYYFAVMKKNYFERYDCVEISEIGHIKTSTETYKVYKFKIDISVDDKLAFRRIDDYLHRLFNIWLLEQQPELIPIWPPVVDQDVQIPIIDNEPVICAVSSGNNNPDVYTYSDRGVLKTPLKKTENDSLIVDLTLRNSPITLSVDRKYVGREITFQKKKIIRTNYSYDIGVSNSSETSKTLNELTRTDLSSDLTVISNGKIELYLGTMDKKYRHISIRENETFIPKQDEIHEFIVIVEDGIYKYIVFEEDKFVKIIENDLEYEKLFELLKGDMVPIPRWAASTLEKMCENDSRIKQLLLKKSFADGKISVELLKHLKKLSFN